MGTKYHTKSTNHCAQPFSHGKRFQKGNIDSDLEKNAPGPQDYTNKTIEPDGGYFLSNMKSSGRRTFLNGRRNLKLTGNKETPGPGSYRVPSDFGHYETIERPATARA